MILSDICNELNKIAPENTALSFDNVGLLVGNDKKDIKKILISLDLTREVLDEAIFKEVDLIITHHPLIFNPIKSVTTKDITGNIITYLIKNDIALYSSHTNLDKSEFGTNMLLANKLGLINPKFIDGDDDIILVTGDKNTNMKEIISKIKEVLFLDYVRFVGEDEKEIKKIGVATGSGDSYKLFSVAKKENVDLLITGDLKYHTMLFAKDIGLNVIDATHFHTENIISQYLKELLVQKLDDTQIDISTVHENVFKTL